MTNIFKKMFKDIVNWNKIAPPVDHWNISIPLNSPQHYILCLFLLLIQTMILLWGGNRNSVDKCWRDEDEIGLK